VANRSDAAVPTSSLEIRQPRQAELADLAALLVRQLREHGNELPDAALSAAAAGMIAHPQRGRFLVAREGDAMVGFAALSFLWTLERGGRAAWLDELYVIPERRGHGFGNALLQAALRVAREAGALAVDLEIETGHERAASLYQRAGFAPLARTRWALDITPSPPAARAEPAERRGGCFCGAVRYRISGVSLDVAHCHCAICRRTSGAPFVTWATVPRESFAFTSGAAAELHSTPHARRGFCGACGTALTFQRTDDRAWIDVAVGSLDEPEGLVPTRHIWTASQLSWLHIDDDLPRHPDGGPSDGR
jgi:GNAT superfamily N-acetyltransferase